MRFSTRTTCIWPGLTRLWLLGDWSGLLVATLFAIGLNIALLASFVWPFAIPAGLLAAGWLLLIGFWGISVLRSLRTLSLTGDSSVSLGASSSAGMPASDAAVGSDDQGLFLQAQGEYLRGHWYEAESHLKKLLRRSGKDVDARLMLATLYRRTQRVDDAEHQLQTLQRMPGSDKWRCEIAHEHHLLQSLAGTADGGADETKVTKSSQS